LAGLPAAQKVIPEKGLLLSIQLRHPEVTLSELTRRIGLEPDVSAEVGTPRRGPGQRLWKETYWCLTLVDWKEDNDLNDALALANLWIAERRDAITWFRDIGGRIDYYISISMGEYGAQALTPDVLGECVAFGVEIGFEIFAKIEPDQSSTDGNGGGDLNL
jgi:hypothetical protein